MTSFFDKFIEQNKLGFYQLTEDERDMELVPMRIEKPDKKIIDLVYAHFDTAFSIRATKKNEILSAEKAEKDAYLKKFEEL